ncbi:MAG: hypothetical protein LBF61_04050, partial [Azoarcus sp.]|nr:hypothetical protein [Azoarcus sp.]
MKIKPRHDIEWDELPRIETPFFARANIGCCFTGILSPRAYQVRGLEEAFRQCRYPFGGLYPYPPEDSREDVFELLARIDDGAFVLVHDGEWEYPMACVLRWQTKEYLDGFRIPHPHDRISWRKMPLEGRWVADYTLPMMLRLAVERCLEKGRRDASLHRGLPERLWWNLWRQGCGQSAPDSEADEPAPVKQGGGDRIVSLKDPEPGGFVKVGLFSPSPPRMSDKAFEANMCEWA